MSEETKDVVVRETHDLYLDYTDFDDAQRRALALTSSVLVPKRFQGKDKIGDALMAMDMANRLRVPIMTMMQSMYEVHGQPGITGKFLHALLNSCGRFRPLDFDFEYEKDGSIKSCTARAYEFASQKDKSITLTKADVTLSGWDKPKGSMMSPWKTMPKLMYIYRSASWFAKAYAPDLVLGMNTVEELKEMSRPIKVKPDQIQETEDHKEKFKETMDQVAADAPPSWWDDLDHWQFKKVEEFYLAILCGYGIPFKPHEIKVKGELMILGDLAEEKYNVFGAKNQEAFGTLTYATEETKEKIRRKFVFSLQIDPAQYDKLEGGTL